MPAGVAGEGDGRLGSGDEEAAGAGEVVVDGDEADPDRSDSDLVAIGDGRAGRTAPGQVAGVGGGPAKVLHRRRVVQRDIIAQVRDQAGVVEVEMGDEKVRAAIPGVTAVDPGQVRRDPHGDQVGSFLAQSRLETEREEGAAGSVLASEVEEAPSIAMLDDELQAGRVPGVEEVESRPCALNHRPTIIFG